jgi:hypothetical protein
MSEPIDKALKFVIGAVARKDFVEELCHVSIKNGRAIAYDGMLSMSTPIDIGLEVMPHARMFLKALQACKGAIAMHVTPTGNLIVKSGNFKATVKCLDKENPTPQPLPEGEIFELTPLLLESIRTLAPLMAIDASRPWARGLCICGNSTFATNNIVLAEHWHGSNFPREIIIPADAVNELLRVGETPTHAQITENSASFHFPGDRWIRTTLVDGQWPHELVMKLLDKGGNPVDVPQELFTEITRLKAFVDGVDQGIRIYEDHIRTNASEDTEGARVDFDLPGGAGHFNIQQFLTLEGIVKKIDFSMYPNPCYWVGGKARGVIIGRAA